MRFTLKPCKEKIIVAVLVIIGLLARIPLLVHTPYYNSDTGVLDLMALHFLKGQFSWYYWAEHYYGVLDPFLLMPLFHYYGCYPQVSQLIPYLFSGVFLFLYHRYVSSIAKPWVAHLSTLWLAVPTPFLARYTFSTYNYIFGIVFGMLHFLLAQRLFVEKKRSIGAALSLGLVAGFSWYYFRFILFFWAAIGVSLWFNARGPEDLKHLRESIRSFRWKTFFHDVIALRAVHPAPAWRPFLVFINWLNLLNGAFSLFLWFHDKLTIVVGSLEMKFLYWPTLKISIQAAAGVFLVVRWNTIWAKAKTYARDPIFRSIVIGFIVGYLPAIMGGLFGYEASSPGKLAALPVVIKNLRILVSGIFPFMLCYGEIPWLRYVACAVTLSGIGMLAWRFIQLMKNRQSKPIQIPFMLSLFVVNLLMCIFCNELDNESSGRYLLPFYITIPLGIAWLVECMPRWAKGAAVAVLVLCLAQAGITQLYGIPSDVPDYRQLIRTLHMEGIRGGYADYWVAYKMTAIAQETLIMAPGGYKNRYQPYIDYVGSLRNIVLLGGPVLSPRKGMFLLGHTYKVLHQRMEYGFLVTYLEQLT